MVLLMSTKSIIQKTPLYNLGLHIISDFILEGTIQLSLKRENIICERYKFRWLLIFIPKCLHNTLQPRLLL